MPWNYVKKKNFNKSLDKGFDMWYYLSAKEVMDMTLKDLHRFAEEFLQEEFNMSLNIPIKLNGRLKRAGGRFILKEDLFTRSLTALEIDLNKTVYENNPIDVVLDILKHELVHYALFEQGLPFRDGEKVFENTLTRLGISSTNTVKVKTKAHIYKCDCGKQFVKRNTRLPRNMYFECECGNHVTSDYWVKETIG